MENDLVFSLRPLPDLALRALRDLALRTLRDTLVETGYCPSLLVSEKFMGLYPF